MTEKEGLEKRIRELEWQVIELKHDLIHDPLTGLKTRLFFEEQVGSYLGIAEREGKELSLAFFDIDHFKNINDTYGHTTGDLVLRRVAQAIQQSLRGSDTVSRWGGEEILASMPSAQESSAAAKAEEIRKAVASLSFPDLPELEVTLSAGIAEFEKGMKLAELVKRADQALYKAKETGRNKVVSYSEMLS